MAKETVYIGRDNEIDFQLEDDSVTPGTYANTDLTAATKVSVVLDTTTEYDSVAYPDVVKFTPGGIVTLALGSVITEEGDYSAEIVVYDNTNDDGVAWQPRFTVTAKTSVPV